MSGRDLNSMPPANLERTQAPTPICYVISAISTTRAGTEGHLLRLLGALDRSRFRPFLVVLKQTRCADAFLEKDIPVETLGFRSFKRPGDWRCIGRLARRFQRRGVQIVELHGTDAHFVGALAARWAKVPVVISCRRSLGYRTGPKELALTKLGNRYVTCLLANSREVARRNAALEGLSADDFEVVHNGVDLSLFAQEAQTQPLPRFVQAARGRQIVAVAANLRPVKNHEGLLQAIQMVRAEVDDVLFAMLGDGSLRQSLEHKAVELGVSDHVLWLGSVPASAPYLVRSHIGCLASHSEGFSNSLLEYMAASLPVVATRVGGNQELILEGQTGMTVAPGDMHSLAGHLIDLLRNPQRRDAIGSAARRHVENHYTLQQQVKSYEHLYSRQLVQRPAKSPRGAGRLRARP